MSQYKSDLALDYTKLRYNLLPGKYFGVLHQPLYEKLYKFWHDQWSHTFAQIQLPFSKTSEEFCRHDEVTCLTLGDRVVACALLDYFDLNSNVQKQHHYFTNYPSDILEQIKLRSHGVPVFTFGYLAVAQEFRKNFAFSDIILGLAFRRLLESYSKVMITYTRNTRRTNDLTYRIGAIPLAQNLLIRDEPSDFVYFDSSSLAKLKQNSAYPVIQRLWEDKIFVPSLNIVPNNKGRSYDKNDFEHSL